MRIKILFLIILLIPIFGLFLLESKKSGTEHEVVPPKKSNWFILHRKSGVEYLYFGTPGDANNSKIVRKFHIKSGASWSPTPLPNLLGREYWRIVKKESSAQNPETAPYFLQLDVPASEDWPYGPVPYEECEDEFGNKIQCDWILPGYFGLHGINGNDLKLSESDPGSSGCVRHNDSDITYLYNLLNPEELEIRYYIEDN